MVGEPKIPATARNGPWKLYRRNILTGMIAGAALVATGRAAKAACALTVLREDVADWFEIDSDSPYMLLVADVAPNRQREVSDAEQALFGIDKLNVPRSDIPAVTHVDYSARIQTVHWETNPRYHALISKFKEITGCPVIVNTSFNIRGEPIVCTPENAWRCFMGTDIEILVVGNCFLIKEDQDPALKLDYKDAFELD